MSSTGATADGFDGQFGVGRGGGASRQLIGNVEALCQSIDPGRVFWFKYGAFLSYSHPDTRSTDMTGLQAELEAAFRKLPIAPPVTGPSCRIRLCTQLENLDLK
jgi:hypothetical protein